MSHKKMVEVNLCKIYISCRCGITWKIPFGRGKGPFELDFRCDGIKGCSRRISVNVEDHRVVNVIGVGNWWLEEVI